MPNYSPPSILMTVRNLRKDVNRLSVYARITINGKRAEISLRRSISLENWDEAKGKAIGTSDQALQLNGYLDEVYLQLMQAYKELLSRGGIITAQAVKARFLGTDEEHKTLRELIQYHNTTQATVLKPGTLKNYFSTEKYLYRFLAHRYKRSDIHLKELNYRFISDFEFYIRSHKSPHAPKPCTNNGAMKHLERLMKMVNMAVRLEWIERDPFRNYRLKFKKSERVYLSERELRLIEQTSFTLPGIERIKDVFLFSCYTGLSYIDLRNLKREQMIRGIDGHYWIYTKREKTSEVVKIPLLPKAMKIIRKYENDSQVLNGRNLIPTLSNQRLNKGIREIIEACGIHKYVTFHTARHTFATTVTLSNGVPIETVSKLLGHTKLSTTQIYARVLDKKIGEDMELLRSRLLEKEKRANFSVKNAAK
jgi:integrase